MITLHEDGTFELENEPGSSAPPDDYYEAPAGCLAPGECAIKEPHRLSDCMVYGDE